MIGGLTTIAVLVLCIMYGPASSPSYKVAAVVMPDMATCEKLKGEFGAAVMKDAKYSGVIASISGCQSWHVPTDDPKKITQHS